MFGRFINIRLRRRRVFSHTWHAQVVQSVLHCQRPTHRVGFWILIRLIICMYRNTDCFFMTWCAHARVCVCVFVCVCASGVFLLFSSLFSLHKMYVILSLCILCTYFVVRTFNPSNEIIIVKIKNDKK